jgi:DNA-binding transcriptional MerR regulator
MHNPFEEIAQRLNFIENLLQNINIEGIKIEPKPEIMTGEQLCEKLDVTIQTLIRWRQKGKIPYFQIGSSIRYDFKKVLNALEKIEKIKQPLTFKEVKMTKQDPLPLRDKDRNYHEYIYLMKNNANGRIKIGISVDPRIREKTLQSAEPDVQLIHKWLGSKTDEQNLHTRFSDCRIRGEWFSLNEFQVNEIIAYMNQL